MRALLTVLVVLSLPTPGFAGADPAVASRVCLRPSEVREAISEHKLVEPLRAVRAAQASVHHGELLSSRLCRAGDGYVYEVTLLKKDGRVVRVFMNAEDGKIMPTRKPR